MDRTSAVKKQGYYEYMSALRSPLLFDLAFHCSSTFSKQAHISIPIHTSKITYMYPANVFCLLDAIGPRLTGNSTGGVVVVANYGMDYCCRKSYGRWRPPCRAVS